MMTPNQLERALCSNATIYFTDRDSRDGDVAVPVKLITVQRDPQRGFINAVVCPRYGGDCRNARADQLYETRVGASFNKAETLINTPRPNATKSAPSWADAEMRVRKALDDLRECNYLNAIPKCTSILDAELRLLELRVSVELAGRTKADINGIIAKLAE